MYTHVRFSMFKIFRTDQMAWLGWAKRKELLMPHMYSEGRDQPVDLYILCQLKEM